MRQQSATEKKKQGGVMVTFRGAGEEETPEGGKVRLCPQQVREALGTERNRCQARPSGFRTADNKGAGTRCFGAPEGTEAVEPARQHSQASVSP